MWTPPPPKEREEKKKGRQGVIDWFLMPFLSKVDLTSETQGIQVMWKTGEENRNPKNKREKKDPQKTPNITATVWRCRGAVAMQTSVHRIRIWREKRQRPCDEPSRACLALYCNWQDFASVLLSLLKLTPLASGIKSCISDAHVKAGKNECCREQRCAFCCVDLGDVAHWLLFSSLLFVKETLHTGNSNYICWRRMQH